MDRQLPECVWGQKEGRRWDPIVMVPPTVLPFTILCIPVLCQKSLIRCWDRSGDSGRSWPGISPCWTWGGSCAHTQSCTDVAVAPCSFCVPSLLLFSASGWEFWHWCEAWGGMMLSSQRAASCSSCTVPALVRRKPHCSLSLCLAAHKLPSPFDCPL